MNPVVYFIQSGDGHIKIGFSRNVASRMQALQVSHPTPLTLIGACPGSFELEGLLHSHFAPLREEGEWFKSHPALLEMMTRLRRDPGYLFRLANALKKASEAADIIFGEHYDECLWNVAKRSIEMFGGADRIEAELGIPRHRALDIEHLPLRILVGICRRDPQAARFFATALALLENAREQLRSIALAETARFRRQLELDYQLGPGQLDSEFEIRKVL